ESRALPATEGGFHPFFSPDGRSLAFTDGYLLKRIDLAGGAPRVLTSRTNFPWHASWGRGGVLLFIDYGLSRMDPSGGPSTQIDSEFKRIFPVFLSDGRRYLTLLREGNRSSIQLASLESPGLRLVLDNVFSAPSIARTPGGRGYLLYMRDSALLAQPF